MNATKVLDALKRVVQAVSYARLAIYLVYAVAALGAMVFYALKNPTWGSVAQLGFAALCGVVTWRVVAKFQVPEGRKKSQ